MSFISLIPAFIVAILFCCLMILARLLRLKVLIKVREAADNTKCFSYLFNIMSDRLETIYLTCVYVYIHIYTHTCYHVKETVLFLIYRKVKRS